MLGSDGSQLEKVEQTGKLANYQLLDAHAHWRLAEEAKGVAQQGAARLDNMLNPAFAVPWVAAHLLGRRTPDLSSVSFRTPPPLTLPPKLSHPIPTLRPRRHMQ